MENWNYSVKSPQKYLISLGIIRFIYKIFFVILFIILKKNSVVRILILKKQCNIYNIGFKLTKII